MMAGGVLTVNMLVCCKAPAPFSLNWHQVFYVLVAPREERERVSRLTLSVMQSTMTAGKESGGRSGES